MPRTPQPDHGTAGRPADASSLVPREGKGTSHGAETADSADTSAAHAGDDLASHPRPAGESGSTRGTGPTQASRSSLLPAQPTPAVAKSSSPMRGPAVVTTVLDFIERQLSRCSTVWQLTLVFIVLGTFLIGGPLVAASYIVSKILTATSLTALISLAVAATGGGSVLFLRRLRGGAAGDQGPASEAQSGESPDSGRTEN